MRLNYLKINNFGDALNPMIFNKFLPGFFDDDPSADFFGIGSLIGANMNAYSRKIIFGTGFAYGSIPQIDASYDIICVRGPLTAKALKIDSKLAITDGAALLHDMNFEPRPKVYDFSFMPHFESETKFPWKNICSEAGIHYVSPKNDPVFVIDEILKTKTVIAEAMHFAIVADTLRVPWIAVKSYPGINELKWKDWTSSLNLTYDPSQLNSLFVKEQLINKLKEKTGNRLPGMAYGAISTAYVGYQNAYLKKDTVTKLEQLKKRTPQLSDENIFHIKLDALLSKINEVKRRYPRAELL